MTRVQAAGVRVDPRGPALVALLGLLTAFGPMSIDMYLPALPAIRDHLGASTGAVQLTLSAFMVGLAIGQIVYGPLSDRYGRKPLVLVGIVVFIFASALCALSPDIEWLLAARCLQAFGAGAGAALARAVVRDLYDLEAGSRVYSLMMLVMLLAPLLAPWVGGQVLVLVGWRAIFWALALFGVAALVFASWRMPETLAPADRRAAGLAEIARGYLTVLRNRRTFGCALLGALSFTGLFTYLSMSPFVYIEVFGVAPQDFGLVFALTALGVMVGAYANSRLVMRIGVRPMLLYGACWSAVAGLALLAVAWLEIGGLDAIVICLVAFFVPHSITNANALSLALEPFSKLAGTASAMVGAIRFAVGGAFGVAIGAQHDGTAWPMAAGIAASSIAVLATYWFLVRR